MKKIRIPRLRKLYFFQLDWYLKKGMRQKMKLNIKKLGFENAINKEWVITNGLGGFASSTIIGTNTRKYHGLLVAPLDPPAKRYLYVSKLDESIEIDGQKYGLYTNMCVKRIFLKDTKIR